MDFCLNCHGAIGEAGKAYGYAGKWCMCPVNPATMYQRPSKNEDVNKFQQTYCKHGLVKSIPCHVCQIEDLERRLQLAKKALNKIEDVTSFKKHEPLRTNSYGDWELRLIAREALSKLDAPPISE